MGSCVSVHKSPESVMSHRWSFGSSNGKPHLIPPPVPKPGTLDGGNPTSSELALDPPCPPSRFHDDGSKEETFFDSHTWLDSDCEEDFLSINGDSTPSAGSTPVHHLNSSSRKPLVPEQFPHQNKKLLSELFKESSRNHLYLYDEEDNAAASSEENAPENAKAAAEATISSPVPHRFKNRSPSNSECSGERTPTNASNGGVVIRANDKSGKSAQCCLPRMMIFSRSFSERKRKASPAHSSRMS